MTFTDFIEPDSCNIKWDGILGLQILSQVWSQL